MIYQGDCLDILKTLPENSVDSLITDPPAGISFMGKSWDSDKGGSKEWIAWMASVMLECKRVLKPGAHGLVWAIPRTSHWTATACEDAGFEIRDVVTHLFGSGFPKSLDVSKAIDKAVGAERKVLGIKTRPDGSQRPNMSNWSPEEGASSFRLDGDFEKKNQLTAPASSEAKQWDGWGTSLKPASEHWVLIRKPCSEKTIAANVLKWGTGAINIDESRIPGEIGGGHRMGSQPNGNGVTHGEMHRTAYDVNQGRFPANLVLSCDCESSTHAFDCAVGALDRQSGLPNISKGKIGASPRKNIGFKLSETSADRSHLLVNYPTDGSQGASRFFYCAKVSTSERNAGLEMMPNRQIKNTHPTVKPQKLMRYFCKMVTPPGGIVLDPFMGSGSTGLAAKKEDFGFIGIEQESEYFEIAQKRMVNL